MQQPIVDFSSGLLIYCRNYSTTSTLIINNIQCAVAHELITVLKFRAKEHNKKVQLSLEKIQKPICEPFFQDAGRVIQDVGQIFYFLCNFLSKI
jgi:hypothetical protein